MIKITRSETPRVVVMAWYHYCAVCGVNIDSPGQWSMFSSFMLGECGLNDWNINSEIVRAVASDPVGPYKMVERVAGPFVSGFVVKTLICESAMAFVTLVVER